MLKLGDNYWLEEENSEEEVRLDDLLVQLETEDTRIFEASLCCGSKEVANYIAGGIATKFIRKHKCTQCSTLMIAKDTSFGIPDSYLEILSRGGLTTPSDEFSDLFALYSPKQK